MNIMPPPFATVLVVGGGPAGSYASAVLAQEGVDVVCCEAAYFPRYHIGESLLASVKAYLEIVDVVEKIGQVGLSSEGRYLSIIYSTFGVKLLLAGISH